MLALKLVLVPMFLALVSLAGRRWGPGVAGWLAGLPVVGGPILLFLAIERGTQFAALAAAASLAAVAASLSFNVAYSWMSRRWRWPLCYAVGVAAWLVVAALIARTPLTVWGAGAVALLALAAAQRAFPPVAPADPGKPLPHRELVLRMIAGAALTLAVTGAAGALGATWSGLLTVFPLLGSVLAVFSHRGHGAPYAITLLRAMASGLYGFAAFCLCLSLALPAYGITLSFAGAVTVALVVQWCVLMTPNQVVIQAATK